MKVTVSTNQFIETIKLLNLADNCDTKDNNPDNDYKKLSNVLIKTCDNQGTTCSFSVTHEEYDFLLTTLEEVKPVIDASGDEDAIEDLNELIHTIKGLSYDTKETLVNLKYLSTLVDCWLTKYTEGDEQFQNFVTANWTVGFDQDLVEIPNNADVYDIIMTAIKDIIEALSE